MALPEHTSRLIYASGEWTLPGADDMPCEGARFHSPTPLFTEFTRLVPEAWLVGYGINPSVLPQTAWLCGTCRDNLAILQQIYLASNGDVPWAVRREFGNDLRALASRGWTYYQRVMEGRSG